ncbi:MAG: 16S rRNA (cytosine(1402)-N(4))-methyltransferase RsmH [Planctomycetes bacterium]|nr:16S rRNA (cytosine(1402)-N(4))-methyltransferase RsmH [Planctomycetota bacterium]
MSERWGHRSVLLDEVLEYLAPRSEGTYGDLTLGAGGHAEAILEASAPNGRVIGFDRDASAAAIAKERLARFGDRLQVVVDENIHAAARLAALGIDQLDGALLDLGVSSMQLDQGDRGFSIREDGPLDMRMAQSERGTTAEDLINEAGVAELERILREFGEEPRARAIARKIVEVRKRTRIRRTRELAELVRSVTGSGGRTHPATRVFQALRIAVNGELEGLKQLLPDMTRLIRPGGRLAVIAFHSLEDRIVKHHFREVEATGGGDVLTKKPLVPTDLEIDRNPRARSARLRVLAVGKERD